jgi:hypothetical protein
MNTRAKSTVNEVFDLIKCKKIIHKKRQMMSDVNINETQKIKISLQMIVHYEKMVNYIHHSELEIQLKHLKLLNHLPILCDTMKKKLKNNTKFDKQTILDYSKYLNYIIAYTEKINGEIIKKYETKNKQFYYS